MRAINDINAPKGLDLSWRLQSLANMAKQKIRPLLGFSRVLVLPITSIVNAKKLPPKKWHFQIEHLNELSGVLATAKMAGTSRQK